MTTSRLLITASLFALFAAAGHAALPHEYDALREKSIFSKERVRRASTMPTTRSSTAPSASPVLVGILRQDDGPAALFEIPGAGRLPPLRPGEALPGGAGIVDSITLDYVEYSPSSGTGSRRVLVGRSLDGSESPLAATTQAVPADTPLEGEDIIARMKRRHQQEVGK